MQDNSFARRTRGDGQEKLDVPEINPADLNSSLETPTASASSSTVETTTCGSDSKIAKYLPKGKIYNLVPKLKIKLASPSVSGSAFNKPREPRFVPFEPYKAAVTPLMHSTASPKKKRAGYNSKVARNRNNIDVNILASQLAANVQNMSVSSTKGPPEQRPSDWELMYNDMRKEKEYAEKQLKYQSQVNSELKNLLIAAVGEDLNDRVNVLTEDKLTLARALLDSSNDLSSHSEQIEYLAGQCEVWRSKFLASSLMLEELARWKTTLLEKNKHLVASNKAMLHTMHQLREMQAELLKNLSFLTRDSGQVNIPSANVIDLAMEAVNISQQYALVNSATLGVPRDLQLDGLDPLTAAEKSAQEAIQITENNLIRTDDPFRAIVTHAFPSIAAMKEAREAVIPTQTAMNRNQ